MVVYKRAYPTMEPHIQGRVEILYFHLNLSIDPDPRLTPPPPQSPDSFEIPKITNSTRRRPSSCLTN